MTCLLTGASGFIGSALLRTAQLRGLAIKPVFRRAVASDGVWPEAVIQPAIAGDTDWQSALAGVQVVIHAAARAHVMREAAVDPLAEFREVNVEGTLNLARQAAAAGVRRFVFISSIGVNGGQTFGQPFTAADAPAPAEPYAVSKLEAERGLLALAASPAGREMEVVIIRPPLVYGPGAPGNFGRLVAAVHKGICLPLGAVHNRRTLVALDNLVDLILLCTHHPAAANQVLLAGDAEDLSTTELLRRIGAALGRPARLLPVPVELMEFCAGLLGRRATVRKICGNLQVDISETRQLLGWTPSVSVDEGLRKIIESRA